MSAHRMFRHSERDAMVLGAAALHGALLVAGLAIANAGGSFVKVAVIVPLALAMCWGCNTVAHIHIHRPLFRNGWVNAVFRGYLTVLLAVPQGWWRTRHLQHHGIHSQHVDVRAGMVAEWAILLVGIGLFAALAPALLIEVYLPALGLGLGLCAMQGRGEHPVSDAGVDHHGTFYNRLWFNDGFHCAHHRNPETHWTSLPTAVQRGDGTSAWPPIIRLLDFNGFAPTLLDFLERSTFDVGIVRRFLLRSHSQAFDALLPVQGREQLRQITVVGGGLFPRTVLVLGSLLPNARFTIIDSDAQHLARARALLDREAAHLSIAFQHSRFDGEVLPGCDLLVLPLAFRGDRARTYRFPPARLVAVHDWLWRGQGCEGRCVSPFLLKRINLISARPRGETAPSP